MRMRQIKPRPPTTPPTITVVLGEVGRAGWFEPASMDGDVGTEKSEESVFEPEVELMVTTDVTVAVAVSITVLVAGLVTVLSITSVVVTSDMALEREKSACSNVRAQL